MPAVGFPGRCARSVVLVAGLAVVASCGDEAGDSSDRASLVDPTSAVESAEDGRSTGTVGASSEPSESTSTDVPLAGTFEVCPAGYPPTLVAVDIATGEQRWSYCPEAPATFSVMDASDELVVAASRADRGGEPALVAVDAATGELRWRVVVDGLGGMSVPGPVSASGVIVVAEGVMSGIPTAIVGIDETNGHERWRISADGAALAATTDDLVILGTAPMPGAVPTTGSLLSSFDRGTGEARDMLDGDGFVGPYVAAVQDTTAVVSSFGPDGPAWAAVDTSHGSELWRSTQFGQTDLLYGAMIGAGQVFLAEDSNAAKIIAVGATSGVETWSAPGVRDESAWVFDDDAVYVVAPETQEMIAYELATGAERWRQPDFGFLYWAFDGLVFVDAGDASIVAVSADDGQSVWTFEIPSVDGSWPTAVRAHAGLVYVSISDLPPGD